MPQFYKTDLDKVVIHRVGNKGLDEGMALTERAIELDEKLQSALLNFFLKQFKELPAYSFSHPAELNMNNVYSIVSELFHSKKKLPKSSQQLAQILYDLSTHPNIKSGEFYVAIFSNCEVDEKMVDAIGIFKSENKDSFLQIKHESKNVEVGLEDGININKLDKGCVILNSDEENGFIVYCLDNTSRGNEAVFWKNEFLGLKPKNDNYHFTSNMLQLTKQYVTSNLPVEFEVNKTDQIDYLNKSVQYFKENGDFNIKEFEKEIFDDPQIIKSFRRFGSEYIENHDVHIADSFEISGTALKKQVRSYKSVIKLDKNFHIYVHGPNELIEQGVEKDGRKYYKIYYNQEV